MSKSIAERALVAYEAELEEGRLKREAEIVSLRAKAVNAIILAAESFDLEIDVDDIEPAVCSASVTTPLFAAWWIVVPVDDDLGLKFEWSSRSGKQIVEVTADYADQLYWDLPPGEEKKGSGGGTYGCYGLSKSYGAGVISNLSVLGKAIVRTRAARAAWQSKWETK